MRGFESKSRNTRHQKECNAAYSIHNNRCDCGSRIT